MPVAHYEIEFTVRTVTLAGVAGESYVESYPAVEL